MIITLTTDFGQSDHFTGVMKGVILGIAPRVSLVDITHEIPPFEILEGAYEIAQAYKHFPKKTVHVVVVDPGVGTERRPILAEAGGQYFIAPDNGVLSMIYQHEKHKVRVITNAKYWLKNVSRTFHGRDVFAPSAAHLATGAAPASFGKVIQDYVQLAAIHPNRMSRHAWTGTVLKADRFGNLITNLHIDEFSEIRTRAFEISVGLQRIHRLALTFGDCDPGELFVIVGSTGYLEIAMNQESAAKKLGCGAGAPVDLTLF
jgi:S-adenosyl-L-methionine hydrolase (adenosine-forming)